MKESYPQTDRYYCHSKALSWTSIIVGAFVAIGLSFLLNLFAVAIGLTSFSIREGSTAFAAGGFVGLCIGTFVVMFVSGMVAGYLGRSYGVKKHLGELYGFASWCLALILTIMLASHVGNFVSNFNHMVTADTVVTTTSNENAPAVSTNETSTGQTQAVVNPEKAATSMGLAAFVTFFLFFLGALASCFGGRFGMCHCCKGDDTEGCGRPCP